MFCKWCGKKLDENITVCRYCNKEQESLVNGNGFWDLCKIEPNPLSITPESGSIKTVGEDSKNTNEKIPLKETAAIKTIPTDTTNKDSGKTKKKKKHKMLFRAVIIFVCVILIMAGVGASLYLAQESNQEQDNAVSTHCTTNSPDKEKTTTQAVDLSQPNTQSPDQAKETQNSGSQRINEEKATIDDKQASSINDFENEDEDDVEDQINDKSFEGPLYEKNNF